MTSGPSVTLPRYYRGEVGAVPAPPAGVVEPPGEVEPLGEPEPLGCRDCVPEVPVRPFPAGFV